MKKLLVAMLLAGPAVTCLAQSSSLSMCSGMALGPNGALNGFVPSSSDLWHTDISAAPLDPNSNKIITTVGDLAGAYLHPDFSSVAGGNYGIPYEVVDSTQTVNVPVGIKLYPTESDITFAPVPANAPVEGAPGSCPVDSNDRHVIVLDRNKCVAYEYWQGAYCNAGWSASNTALWDMSITQKRPYGMTSADAAGLSIFEGLVRYDEVISGVINHAIRFTAQHTKSNANRGLFAAPASHAAGNNSTTDNIMGMRIRLKAGFDISGYSLTNQIILKAMKQYGMILADNGSNMFFQGTPDARWNDSDLNKLKAVPSSAFEVVAMGTLYDSVTAPKGAAPAIASFTASASTVAAGTPVTLTANVTGASYSYVDKAGFYRAPIVVTPTATTTYVLTSRNAFGSSTASTTVTVGAGLPVPTLNFVATPVSTSAGNMAFTLSATSASTGAVTYSVVSGPGTVSGSALTFSTAGTVSLRAAQAATSSYAAAQATLSVTVNPTSLPVPTLNFVATPISTSAGNMQFTLSATSASTGAVSYSVVSGPGTVSGSALTFSTAGTVSLLATQAATSSYAAAQAALPVTVNGTSTLPVPVLHPLATSASSSSTNMVFWLSATSASNGAVSYSVVSGPGTFNGNTLTFSAAGSVVVLARQAATSTYQAAQASLTVTANGTSTLPTPTLNFVATPVSTSAGNMTFTVSATSASSGVVTYSVVSGPGTLGGSMLTFSTAGTVSLLAKEAATSTYAAAQATLSVTVSPTSLPVPTLNFVATPMSTGAGNMAFTLGATSASTGAVTYSVVSGPGTVNTSMLTFTTAGTVSLRATQAATSTYAAGQATLSVTVNPTSTLPTPTVSLSDTAATTSQGHVFWLSTSSNSTGAISYSIVSGPGWLNGKTLIFSAAGTVTVKASQAATTTYAAGSATLTITAPISQ